MKKKILLFIALISAFVCLFAISSSATAINKDTTVTLDGSFTDANGNTVTTVNLYDADGDALIWYLDTNGKLVSAKIASLVTVNSEGVISFTDQSIFLNSTPRKSVIAVNLRDNVKVSGTDINWDGQIKHFDDSKGTDNDTNIASTGFQFGTYSDSGFTIQYFYFPKTAESIVKRMFQGTPVKVVDIEPGTPISTMGMLVFYGARNLTEIYIPNDLAVLPGADGQGLFQNCSSLSSVVFEENSILWNAGQNTFYGCSSLKKLYLPNSVKTFGSEFARSSGIEEFSFGAGFEYFTRRDPNKDPDDSHMWVFWGTSLKKVYMPASFVILNDEYKFDEYTSNDERLDTFDRIFNSAGSFTLFFTGTKEEIEILKTRMSYTQENQSFMSALNNIYSYDEYVAAGSPTGSCAVYDYNLCKAFYNDVHQTAEEASDHNCTTDDLCRCKKVISLKTNDSHNEQLLVEYKDYTKAGTKTQGCINDDCTVIDVTEELKPIFEAKGYSIKNDGCGITTDYKVNPESLAYYKTYLADNGKTFTFGIFIGNSEYFTGDTFVNADGTINNNFAHIQAVNSLDYSMIKCTVADFTLAEKDLPLVMGIYVIDDGKVSYVQHEGTYKGEITKGGVTLDVVTITKIADLLGIDLALPETKALPVENKEN